MNGIEAKSIFPIPRTREVHSFLGLCSYFQKFIERFAVIAKPLYDLLKKDVSFKFTNVELNDFNLMILKIRLMESPILAIDDPHDLTELHC